MCSFIGGTHISLYVYVCICVYLAGTSNGYAGLACMTSVGINWSNKDLWKRSKEDVEFAVDYVRRSHDNSLLLEWVN